MSFTIPDDSPKRADALRFSAELQRALTARDMPLKALSRALGGTSHTKLWQYQRGRILPRLSTALEIAEALQWPSLATLIREMRSRPCAQCGRMFVMEGGSANKRYCTQGCRSAALRLRAHLGQAENAEDAPERRLVARLKAELDLVTRSPRSLSRLAVRDALREYEATSQQSRLRRLQNTADRHMTAVEAFCNACEPDGFCRDSGCPLRPISPLPLSEVREVQIAVRAEGAWGPTNRPRRLAQQRETNAVRWGRPGAREAMGVRARSWWANLTPAERVAHGRKVAAARRGKPSIRDCGCPNRKHVEACTLLLHEATA